MKRIKLFENFLNESKQELKEFCEMNLAYLLDEGFVIDIDGNKLPDDHDWKVGGSTIIFSKETGFTWNEISNHFIPFLERLSVDYTIERAMISFNEGFPRKHESKMVRPTSLMNHDLMLDFLGDTMLRKILIKIEFRNLP